MPSPPPPAPAPHVYPHIATQQTGHLVAGVAEGEVGTYWIVTPDGQRTQVADGASLPPESMRFNDQRWPQLVQQPTSAAQRQVRWHEHDLSMLGKYAYGGQRVPDHPLSSQIPLPSSYHLGYGWLVPMQHAAAPSEQLWGLAAARADWSEAPNPILHTPFIHHKDLKDNVLWPGEDLKPLQDVYGRLPVRFDFLNLPPVRQAITHYTPHRLHLVLLSRDPIWHRGWEGANEHMAAQQQLGRPGLHGVLSAWPKEHSSNSQMVDLFVANA